MHCQESTENPISCELDGRNLTHNETILYKHGEESIVVCKALKLSVSHLSVSQGNTRDMLKKHIDDSDYHIVGILLSRAPNLVHLYGMRGENTVGKGFRLNFVGK